MADRTAIVRSWATARSSWGTNPRTDDEVPVTADGRRLDTPEKVIAFLEEINAKRAAQQLTPADDDVCDPARLLEAGRYPEIDLIAKDGARNVVR